MKKLIRILTVDSVRDLFKYKSFFLLILLLFLLDRFIRSGAKGEVPHLDLHLIQTASEKIAVYVFGQLPDVVGDLLFDWRTSLVLIGLFLLKQLISIWPSSDMRRMHRFERRGFALFSALFSLKWHQFLWDAIAVASLCGIIGSWSLVWYLITRSLWQMWPAVIWLWLLAGLVFMATPLALAGFSYSSKLAVISRGSFGRKLHLFFELFLNRRVFGWSWTFYLVRQVVEAVFVAALPALIILSLDSAWLRIVLAGLIASPVYSFLKMCSFKFFLHVYQDYPEVREEYHQYFQQR